MAWPVFKKPFWTPYKLHLDEETDSRVSFKISSSDEKKTYVGEEYIHFDEVSVLYNIKVNSNTSCHVFLADGETDRGGMKSMDWNKNCPL